MAVLQSIASLGDQTFDHVFVGFFSQDCLLEQLEMAAVWLESMAGGTSAQLVFGTFQFWRTCSSLPNCACYLVFELLGWLNLMRRLSSSDVYLWRSISGSMTRWYDQRQWSRSSNEKHVHRVA